MKGRFDSSSGRAHPRLLLPLRSGKPIGADFLEKELKFEDRLLTLQRLLRQIETLCRRLAT
ncbi:hypothetical protein C5167_023265 [Papaver somniferum]|uniref:Uncharacterized protein n=1 Tax=Papaver somniferum TaxID=3469 RepID=A0A4Y7JP46_PAPSO|nr:hypothetical protein C5167_023265 [Papaver somniferum]